ncbi:MAG TPA: phage tail tape measure protein, partial [Rhodanobacter sp.]|nr:phage tail tape measure protein [Rhodanobacter sp.]
MGNYGRFEQSALTLANASGVMKLAFSGMGAAVLAGVAAVALFVVGAIKGYEEAEKLRVSLIATGGAAGTGAVSLNSMANAVGAATGKWGDARKAVELFVASGKEAGAGLGKLAFDAVNIATVTGQSVEKVAQSLIDIGDAPAKAIAKLNEQYNFLTAAQYAQIAALEEEGRTRDAARLAESAYTSAMNDRAKEVEDNAGILIRAAHAVGNAWSTAWAAVKSVGAPSGLQDQVTALERKRDGLANGQMVGKEWMPGVGANDPRVAQLQAEINDLKAKQVANAFADNAKELAARGNSDAIAAQGRLSNFKTPKERLDDSIKKANSDRLAALYGVVDPAEKAKIEARANQQIADAQKAYESATKVHGAKRASTADPFASLNGLVQKAQVFDQGVGGDKADNAQVTAILAIVDAGAKLIASGKDVAKVQAQVAVGVAALNEGYAKQAKILDADNAVAIKQYQASLDKQNEAMQRSVDAQIAQITLGPKEAARLQQLADLTRKNAEELTNLQLKRDAVKAKGGNTAVFDADISALKKNIDQQVKIVTDGDAKIDAERANGLNGYKTALTAFMDEQKNMAGQMEKLTTSFLGGASDAFAKFVSGTESAKQAFGSLIDSMYQQALKFVANKAIQALFDSFSTTGGGSASSTPGSTAGGWGSLFSNFMNAFTTKSAKGNVFASQGLSAYSGQVVDKPTMFAFAHGAGLMGEAGPEAILPLQRGNDGKLGVAVQGGGRNVSVNQTIVVQGTINRRTASQIAQQTAQKQRIATARNS